MTTRKVIITGAIHTPSMSPYLPVTPEDVTASAIGAAEAGAAVIHLHARDPVTSKPDQTPEAFGPAADKAGVQCRGEHHHRRRARICASKNG